MRAPSDTSKNCSGKKNIIFFFVLLRNAYTSAGLSSRARDSDENPD